MALQKLIQNPIDGANVNYWKLRTTNPDYYNKSITIVVEGWMDAERRNAGFSPNMVKSYALDTDKFMEYFGYPTENSTVPNPMKAAYNYILQEEAEFSGAVSV